MTQIEFVQATWLLQYSMKDPAEIARINGVCVAKSDHRQKERTLSKYCQAVRDFRAMYARDCVIAEGVRNITNFELPNYMRAVQYLNIL